MRKILGPHMSSSESNVIKAIFLRVNGEGKGWCSQEEITLLTSLSESTVRRAVNSLVERGYLEREYRFGGTKREASNYRILFSPGHGDTLGNKSQPVTEKSPTGHGDTPRTPTTRTPSVKEKKKRRIVRSIRKVNSPTGHSDTLGIQKDDLGIIEEFHPYVTPRKLREAGIQEGRIPRIMDSYKTWLKQELSREGN